MRTTSISRPCPWLVILALALPLLQACTSYAPPNPVAGISREALVVQMGTPDMERRMNVGSRLEFPRGPYGKHTWFVYLDSTGQATRAEQVLTEQNFSLVQVGMAQEEVRKLLGRPGEIQGLGRSRGEVWSYRYENFDCKWFQVELTLQLQVRSASYGQPPECMGSDDVMISALRRH